MAKNDKGSSVTPPETETNYGFDFSWLEKYWGQGYDEGTANDDVLVGSVKNDTIKGGSGNDTIFGGEGNDSLSGSWGVDTIHGGEGNDKIDGGFDNDRLFGWQGNDTIYGGTGTDFIDGGEGNDRILGGSDNDWLRGGSGDDRIYGDNGVDVLVDGEGNDRLYGGRDNDLIYVGAGNDRVYGEHGDDRIVHAYGDNLTSNSSNQYDGGDNIDTLYLSFTAEEWATRSDNDDALLKEIEAFREDIKDRIEHAEADSKTVKSDAFGIKAKRIEDVKVLVDGKETEIGPVEDPNALVVAEADKAEVALGDTVKVDVLANDSAEDGVAQVALVDPQDGFDVDEDNNVVYTADTETFATLGDGETAIVAAKYEVTDTDGDSDIAVVEVVVSGANDAPVAEDVAVTVTESDSDVVGSQSEIGAITAPNAGLFFVLDANTGEVTQTTRGLDALTMDDVAPQSGIVIYVNPNTSNFFLQASSYSDGVETPVDVADLWPANYDGEVLAYQGALYLSDPGSDLSLSVSAEGVTTDAGAANISLSLDGFSWAGAGEPIEVSIDGATGSVSASDADDAVIIAPMAEDVDANAVLTYTVDSSETQGNVVVTEDGNFAYNQNNAFATLAVGETATDSFTYTVTDEHGASDTATVTVTVEGENDAPVVQDLTATVAEASSYVTPVEAEMGDQVVSNGGYFYILDQDTGLMSGARRTTGTLTLEDAAPENGIVIQLNPNTANWFAEAASFIDGEMTVIDPSNFSLDGYDGETLVYNEALYFKDQTEDATLTLSVDDLPTADGPANVSFTFTGVTYLEGESPIQITLDGVTAEMQPGGPEGADTVTVTADGYDPDGTDVITYTFDDSATLGDVTSNGDGTFTYSAGGNFDDLALGETATDTFTYTADDGNGGFDTALVTITVDGIDGPRDLADVGLIG